MMIPSIKNDVMATALMTFCRMYDQMEDMREKIEDNAKTIGIITKKLSLEEMFEDSVNKRLTEETEKAEASNG